MAQVEGGKFACGNCGKRHTWKPQLAGRRAKCSCGATVTVPVSPPSSLAADEEDELYDVATPARAPAFGATPARAAAVAGGDVGVAAPLAYHRPEDEGEQKRDRFRDSNIIHPPRDIYAPVAILIVGFGGLVGYAAYLTGDSVVAMVLAPLVWAVMTAIKTAILIGLAFIYAPRLGISFGDLKTAILKFAAIVIFTDALDLWAIEAFTRERTTYTIRRIGLELLIAAGSISFLCHILFEMDGEETGMFALPMAVVSKLLSFFMNIGVIWLLGILFSPAVPAAPAGPVAGGGGGAGGGTQTLSRAPAQGTGTPGAGAAAAATAPATVPSLFSTDDIPDIKPFQVDKVKVTPTDRDRDIARRVAAAGASLQDAKKWMVQPKLNDAGDLAGLIKALSTSGSKELKMEVNESGAPARLYAKLPEIRQGRLECLKRHEEYARQWQIGVDAALLKDHGQERIEIELKQ